MSNAGDVNGDGIGDLIIGAFGANQFTGKSYVVFGVGAAKPTVTIAAPDTTAAEAAQDPGTFRITRTGSTTSDLTVNYTVAGTATNGTDYTLNLTGTAIIPIGKSFVDITITLIDDTLSEGNETVTLTLGSSANYALGNASATVTIADNEIPPNINPIANPDSITTAEDQAITFYVLGKDTDPNNTAGSLVVGTNVLVL